MDKNNLHLLKRSRFLHLCFAITFFTSGLIVNLVQAVLYFTLWPINRRLYRQINWYLCYTIYAQLVFMGDWWANTQIKFYIDKDDFKKYYGKEHGLCVMNHTYEIDWLVCWMLTEKMHLLGNCKAYCKKIIQYVPVLGWCWKFSEFVFLERSFDKDREIINTQIAHLADHPDPMLLLLFPEGTRFTPEKHKASIEFAEKKGLQPLKYHLLPRTKGFIASLPSMRGKVPALYDIEVAFRPDDEIKPTITSLLFGESVCAHLYMRRIPLETVPENEPEQDKFLRDMFVRKDKMRESFLNTGSFFKTSGVPEIEPFTLDRRIHSLVNISVWFIVILVPMLYYLIKFLFSGQLLYFSIGAGIIGVFYLLLFKSIGMTEIKKGSSYGTTTPTKTE